MFEIDDIAAVVATAVKDATAPLHARIAELEKARPEKGLDGKDGRDGKDGEKGLDGKDGAEGIGLADAFIDNEGNLVLTMSDGRTKALGRIQGRDGKDGEKGEAGETFTLDDFDIEQYPDRRSFKFCFTRGAYMHSFEFALPTPLYRGVFKEGQAYEIGDMVTWGGSLWHCDKDTTSKPDGEDWTLCVKKGRDGK